MELEEDEGIERKKKKEREEDELKVVERERRG